MSQGSVVPVIDISGYFTGLETEKRRVAREIGEACRTIGFLLVAGHGVSEELIRRTEETGRAFFDLPDAEKRRNSTTNSNVYRGYYAIETSAVAYSRDDRVAPPDYRELFSINRVTVDPADPYLPRLWAKQSLRQISGRKQFPACERPGPNIIKRWKSWPAI